MSEHASPHAAHLTELSKVELIAMVASVLADNAALDRRMISDTYFFTKVVVSKGEIFAVAKVAA